MDIPNPKEWVIVHNDVYKMLAERGKNRDLHPFWDIEQKAILISQDIPLFLPEFKPNIRLGMSRTVVSTVPSTLVSTSVPSGEAQTLNDVKSGSSKKRRRSEASHQKYQGVWACEACTYENQSCSSICAMCDNAADVILFFPNLQHGRVPPKDPVLIEE